ncbi:plexin-B1-like [Diadema antillarum]|uniref:plexin-B1-like n=1 Tax=Diadema antillarum TaxID=105358 RepID=UPI003A89A276
MIDDAYGNMVTLYDCSVIGGSCTTCVSTSVRPVLTCGWCQPNCQITEAGCNGNFIPHGGADECPAGVINDIFPISGPIEGNTILTITGTNLGQNVSDILSISVADVDCTIDVVNDTYVPGLSVNCLTGSVASVTAGSVRAEIRRGGIVDNATYNSFTYMNPLVTGFSPHKGIAAGGTIVDVMGTDLNTGRDARVTIGGVDCAIQDGRSSLSLSCRTGPLNVSSQEGEVQDLILIVDGAVRNPLEDDKYTYVGDPEIEDYSPKGAVAAGGITQEVTGSGFTFVQEAVMHLVIDGEPETVACTNKTDISFQCPTPAFNSSTSGRRRRQTPEVSVSFALDGYSYTPPEENQFAYFPNPDYNEENYNLESAEGGLITITVNPWRSVRPPPAACCHTIFPQGTNLNALPGAENFITVCIGPGECTLSDVQANFLTCITPDSFPGTGGCNGEALDNPQATYVVVRHGENLEFVIGTITYPRNDSIIVIIVAVVAGFVFLCIIVFAIVFAIGYSNYRSRIKETEVEMQRLMQDARTQVVEGFFIQQEMSDIQEQLKGLGMPFVSNQDYMNSMLFYGAPVKPLASDPENPSEMEERAMMEFSKLLSKKEFLKVLIQTVDNSKSSTIQKSNIASLLTVILVMERKFRYFTSVLMSLMTDTICEAADKNRMKNLFKRTQTMEDKLLTNWIALAMFKFVKESVGHPLYLLYQALKIQCEKGPVDAITGQSFLSLSFDNLLTESKEFTALKLNVESEIGTVEVSVLDVDTITQVKKKILDAMYRQKHTKFQRAATDVDLVIKSGNAGALILRDKDTSSQPSLGWLQLNSLSHYGINDGATVTLVTKQEQPNAGPIAYNGAAENFFSYSTQESHPLANNHEPDVEQQDDVKTYHLVQNDRRSHAVQSADQEEEAQSGACSDLKRVLCFQGNQERRKIREIYLQRLVSVKNSIQDFVEEAIKAMFTIREDEYVNTINNVPFALRFLFKYFDEEASRYDNSAEVAGTWKNNSLPLRFWATILSHPSFIFNMRQSQTADACVIVLNQMLDNACKSVVPKLKAQSQDGENIEIYDYYHVVVKNSSPSRLLFNKELPRYIELIKTYYHNIAQTPALQEDELKMECARIDAEFEGLFSRLGTLKQLYELVRTHESALIKALEEDELCQAANFASSLQRVGNTLDKAMD